MVLIDTSVWIEYLKRNPVYAETIDSLMKKKNVMAFDFVFGELLQGARENEKAKIIALWDLLPKPDIKNEGFHAGLNSFKNQLFEKGIGLIDSALMYAAISTNSKLWTLNKKIINQIDEQFLYK